MTKEHQREVTTVRLLDAVAERSKCDPAAQPNFSAFVRAVVQAFIASGAVIESTRALGHRTNSKTGQNPVPLSIPDDTLSHFVCYAESNGKFGLGALVNSALVLHYFGPGQVAPALPVRGEAKTGWRPVLQAMSVGETREFFRRDVLNTLERARKAAHETAEYIRDALPEFRISTRKTARCLFITRLA
jgi:hypothetical protein